MSAGSSRARGGHQSSQSTHFVPGTLEPNVPTIVRSMSDNSVRAGASPTEMWTTPGAMSTSPILPAVVSSPTRLCSANRILVQVDKAGNRIVKELPPWKVNTVSEIPVQLPNQLNPVPSSIVHNCRLLDATPIQAESSTSGDTTIDTRDPARVCADISAQSRFKKRASHEKTVVLPLQANWRTTGHITSAPALPYMSEHRAINETVSLITVPSQIIGNNSTQQIATVANSTTYSQGEPISISVVAGSASSTTPSPEIAWQSKLQSAHALSTSQRIASISNNFLETTSQASSQNRLQATGSQLLGMISAQSMNVPTPVTHPSASKAIETCGTTIGTDNVPSRLSPLMPQDSPSWLSKSQLASFVALPPAPSMIAQTANSSKTGDNTSLRNQSADAFTSLSTHTQPHRVALTYVAQPPSALAAVSQNRSCFPSQGQSTSSIFISPNIETGSRQSSHADPSVPCNPPATLNDDTVSLSSLETVAPLSKQKKKRSSSKLINSTPTLPPRNISPGWHTALQCPSLQSVGLSSYKVPGHPTRNVIQQKNIDTPRTMPMAVLLSLEGFKASPVGSRTHINQDRGFIHEVAPNFTVFAVFDGHGDNGHNVAQFVSSSFQQQLLIDFPRPTSTPELQKLTSSLAEANILSWLRTNFTEIDRQLVEASGIDCVYSGCTASLALQFDDNIIVAYVGDSKVAGFQFDGKKPFCLVETPEHSPSSKTEYRRIRQLGANVTEQYYQYFSKSISRIVEAGLSVSRSFGDIAARPYGLISEPDFVQFKIPQRKVRSGKKPYFPLMLVVASDGLWDTISPYEILDFVSNAQQSKDKLFESLKEIAEVAWRRRLAAEGRSDDTTAIIALLQ